MKYKILVKENLVKIYNNILPVIKNNPNFKGSQDLIAYYNDENWHEVFMQAYEEFRKGKFWEAIIIDDYAYGPFLLISKLRGLFATSAFDEYSANLIRAHNNSKLCIIPMKRIDPSRLNTIINAYCVSQFEHGRHTTRLQIVHGTMVEAKKTIEFSKEPTKTVVLGSDHAGFALKEAVKEHLIEKGYKVIDVGTKNLDSTHYSLFGPAMVSHFPEASYAIGFCWTGMGMANSLNKFKGIRACVCMTPENAKVAREIYGANTLVMGSKFSNKETALKTVDTYLSTKPVQNPVYKVIDDYGFNFDKSKFEEIRLERGIVVPDELK